MLGKCSAKPPFALCSGGTERLEDKAGFSLA